MEKIFLVKIEEVNGGVETKDNFLLRAESHEEAESKADVAMTTYRSWGDPVQPDEEGCYDFGEVRSHIDVVLEISLSDAEVLTRLGCSVFL